MNSWQAVDFPWVLIPGAQGFVDFVMEEQGIFEQFDLRPEKLQSLNPPTLHLMIAEKQVDIGFAGFTTMATARSQGRDTIVIYGIFSPVNAVFVPHDSDLRGVGRPSRQTAGDIRRAGFDDVCVPVRYRAELVRPRYVQ